MYVGTNLIIKISVLAMFGQEVFKEQQLTLGFGTFLMGETDKNEPKII